VISKRTFSSLLFAATLTGACGSGAYSQPDLPKSVAPGWTLTSLDHAQPPPQLPAGSAPQCWKAVYSGPGEAQIWVCGYSSETGAFDAEQRTPMRADTVKFQEGKRLVIVEYKNAKSTDLEALIRSIQKKLKS
jgi:hypothetical protein